MKNYEKYEDEIKKYKGDNFCKDFVIPHILKKDNCAGIYCSECISRQLLWYLEEYEEPKIDWGKVKVDTPILVRDSENTEWLKKYFAKYEDGIVYVWNLGRTSWTAPHDKSVSAWRYAKLIEDEKEHKEPEVDWSKVEVDTPILVRHTEDEKWCKRHFAKCDKYGLVYTWKSGRTSWTEEDLSVWGYAKLAENEETK